MSPDVQHLPRTPARTRGTAGSVRATSAPAARKPPTSRLRRVRQPSKPNATRIQGASTAVTSTTQTSCVRANSAASYYHENWNIKVRKVACPTHLTEVTGCKPNDDSSLPKADPKVQAVSQATGSGWQDKQSTSMQDCCKPSCSWSGKTSIHESRVGILVHLHQRRRSDHEVNRAHTSPWYARRLNPCSPWPSTAARSLPVHRANDPGGAPIHVTHVASTGAMSTAIDVSGASGTGGVTGRRGPRAFLWSFSRCKRQAATARGFAA